MEKVNNSLNLKNILIPLFFVLLMSYLIYHAINGERGMLAFFELNKEVFSLQDRLDKVRIERLNLEHKVSLLKSNNLDLDLLEEQSKKILGMAKENELIIIKNDK